MAQRPDTRRARPEWVQVNSQVGEVVESLPRSIRSHLSGWFGATKDVGSFDVKKMGSGQPPPEDPRFGPRPQGAGVHESGYHYRGVDDAGH